MALATSFRSMTSYEWTYLVGMEMTPLGTPSLVRWMVAASVDPLGSTSIWYGIFSSSAVDCRSSLTFWWAISPSWPAVESMILMAGPAPSFVTWSFSGTPGMSPAIVTSMAIAMSGAIL